jgi:hypothetical protein
MKIEQRDIELFRQSVVEAGNKIRRFMFIRTTVILLVVLAYVRAFGTDELRQTGPGTFRLDSLSPITGKRLLDLNASPFQGFFLVRNLLVDFGSTKQERVAFIRDSKDSRWPEACRVLVEDPEAAEQFNALLNLAKGTDGRAACSTQLQSIPYQVSELAGREQDKSATRLRETYQKAFNREVNLLGINAVVDLRNWFAFIPLFILISEIYIFIERRKMKLLATVVTAAGDAVTATGVPPVGAYDRLFVSSRGASSTAFSRHPGEMAEILQYCVVVVLIAYLAHAVFWGPFDFGDLVYPALCTTIIIAWYSVRYCKRVGRELEGDLMAVLGFQPQPTQRRLRRRPFQLNPHSRLARFHRPRLQLSSGSSLVLLTIFMSINFNFCSDQNPKGYEFLRNRGLQSTWNMVVHFTNLF